MRVTPLDSGSVASHPIEACFWRRHNQRWCVVTAQCPQNLPRAVVSTSDELSHLDKLNHACIFLLLLLVFADWWCVVDWSWTNKYTPDELWTCRWQIAHCHLLAGGRYVHSYGNRYYYLILFIPTTKNNFVESLIFIGARNKSETLALSISSGFVGPKLAPIGINLPHTYI